MGNRIWISWEAHRRSRELARELGFDLHELLFNGPYFVRALVLSWRTVKLLWRERPRILVVQNPSMILAALVALFLPVFRYFLVVDRHSNFKLHTVASRNPKFQLFHTLSDFSIRQADLTIVTNGFLHDLIEEKGGRGFVLPDKFPDLPSKETQHLGPGNHILYICSFDDDEPVQEVLAAASNMGSEYIFHITGDFRKPKGQDIVSAAPPNVILLGFLLEEEYLIRLHSCDVVVTMTKFPHIMQCGAYEAVAAEKPFVFGPDQAMVDYFSKGCISTVLDPDSISDAIARAVKDQPRLIEEIRELKSERGRDWMKMKSRLLAKLPHGSGEGS